MSNTRVVKIDHEIISMKYHIDMQNDKRKGKCSLVTFDQRINFKLFPKVIFLLMSNDMDVSKQKAE